MIPLKSLRNSRSGKKGEEMGVFGSDSSFFVPFSLISDESSSKFKAIIEFTFNINAKYWTLSYCLHLM
jgi:hypothetical protein